jgi:hypothetical protein
MTNNQTKTKPSNDESGAQKLTSGDQALIKLIFTAAIISVAKRVRKRAKDFWGIVLHKSACKRACKRVLTHSLVYACIRNANVGRIAAKMLNHSICTIVETQSTPEPEPVHSKESAEHAHLTTYAPPWWRCANSRSLFATA